jgi:hypothetical protein
LRRRARLSEVLIWLIDSRVAEAGLGALASSSSVSRASKSSKASGRCSAHLPAATGRRVCRITDQLDHRPTR